MLQKKSCFSWILSKEEKKKKKAHSLPGLCLFSGFKFAVTTESFFWPLEIFGPSDLWCLGHWYSPTPSLLLHGSCISIPPSIRTYNYLPLSLSHSSGIWSVLGFPYTSFIELVSFPEDVFSLSRIFSFYTLSFPSPSCLLQTRSPSLHAANLQLCYVFSITYIYLNGMISTNVNSLAY